MVTNGLWFQSKFIFMLLLKIYLISHGYWSQYVDKLWCCVNIVDSWCWLQVWDVVDRFEILVIDINHHRVGDGPKRTDFLKVTNITSVSSTLKISTIITWPPSLLLRFMMIFNQIMVLVKLFATKSSILPLFYFNSSVNVYESETMHFLTECSAFDTAEIFSIFKSRKNFYSGTLLSPGEKIKMWLSHQKSKTKKYLMVLWIPYSMLWYLHFCHFSPSFGLFMLSIHTQLIQKSYPSFISEWKNQETQSDKSLQIQDLDQSGFSGHQPRNRKH